MKYLKTLNLNKGQALLVMKLLQQERGRAGFRLKRETENTGWLKMDRVTEGYLTKDVTDCEKLITQLQIEPVRL